MQPQLITSAAAANPMRRTAADRLEHARRRVRFALGFADGGELTYETLDIISRALVAVTSELECVAIELDTFMNHERMARR